jgi:glycosyltransferase involved in cell wall biosynthesis
MPPRLTVGLPVYNGENYLAESIEALLGQSFSDFELLIADNASTDSTPEIAHRYERQDSRVRVYRQPRNIGLSPNHNFLVDIARGELFKWAAHDDLYARDLLEVCVSALDRYPDVVLAHAWTAMIDGDRVVTKSAPYPLATDSPNPAVRFRSLLFDDGGDDDGGVIRTEVLRRMARKDSYHHADRTTIAELALHGRFHQEPNWLYFRRDHPQRAERACPTTRSRCANMDPKRANRWRHPLVRLYGEYLWAYTSAIHGAPLSPGARRQCYGNLASWLESRALPGRRPQTTTGSTGIDERAILALATVPTTDIARAS